MLKCAIFNSEDSEAHLAAKGDVWRGNGGAHDEFERSLAGEGRHAPPPHN